MTTRAEFERLVRVAPETLTDLERAARFLYLQRSAFGGNVSGRNFGVAKERPVHPRAMPVILTSHVDFETWLTAPFEIASKLQRPLPNGALQLVDEPL